MHFVFGALLAVAPLGAWAQQGRVERFMVVNAEINRDAYELRDGGRIDLTDFAPGIRAVTWGPVESVTFTLEGPLSRTVIDNGQPWTIFGDKGDRNYFPGRTTASVFLFFSKK